LVIVGGDDGFKNELDETINKLGIKDKILFTGFLQGKDKLAAFVDSNLVVQPSRYEQGAWMPLEAVLCGCPIIVSKGTGSGDDVENIKAGYVIDCQDIKIFADTMLFVLKHPEYGQMQAVHADKWIRENLNIDKNIEQYEKVYGEIVDV